MRKKLLSQLRRGPDGTNCLWLKLPKVKCNAGFQSIAQELESRMLCEAMELIWSLAEMISF